MGPKVTIENVLRRVKDFPPLPQVGTEVLRLLEDPAASVEDLVGLLSKDPALAAKVLRVANSPFYGMLKRISTIQHAVVVLGFQATGSLVLAVATLGALRSPSSTRSGLAARKRFVRHAVACATTARQLAQGRWPNPDEAFLAGLLHDIGKLALMEFFPDEMENLMQAQQADPERPDYLAEQRALGMDHQQVGAALLERWGLPPAIIQAVGRHHEPLDAGGKLAEGRLAALIHTAEALCGDLEDGPEPVTSTRHAVDGAVLAAAGLSEPIVAEVESKLPALVEETWAAWEGTVL